MLRKSSFWDQKEHNCRKKLKEFQEKIFQKNEKSFQKSPKYCQNLLLNQKETQLSIKKLMECKKKF